MTTILKYTIEPNGTELELPASARPLSVAWQSQNVVMWVLLSETEPKVTRRFISFVTREAIYTIEKLQYVGTAAGTFVVHVFEVTE